MLPPASDVLTILFPVLSTMLIASPLLEPEEV
jgi:hypothetical protein